MPVDMHEQVALTPEVESAPAEKGQIFDLHELQLALVGGGIGETIL
jgi:hypothetical protein